MFQYTGEYKKHNSSSSDMMNFYTFTPSPLCDGIPLPVDDELFALLTKAHRLLGILEGMVMYSTVSNIIMELFCLKESCFSLLFDNADSITFYDALKARSSKQESLHCINNLIVAQQYSYSKPITVSELSKICGIIIHGSESTQAVEIRNKQIYYHRVGTNLKAYMPTAPEDILPAFDDLTRFIRMDNHTDLLIKAALVQYQFDMIRPYENRNGMISRILIPMMLLSEQYRSAQYLCISEFLYSKKEEYFDKLSATQWGSGYSFWIKFFLQAICYSAEQAIKQVSRFTEIIAEDTVSVAELAKSSKSVLPVYNYFKRYLISEIKPIAAETGVSYNTNSKVIDLLVDVGILELENMQSRNKVFKYSRIFDAMSILPDN